MEYYEDLSVDETRELGSYTIEKEEIITFAKRFDPLPFHVDEEAAEESVFNGLIASGLHTFGIAQRLFVENMLLDTSARGALGVDTLRWKQPVRPGDTLTTKVEIRKKRPLDNGLGLVHIGVDVLNQDDTTVLSLVALVRFQMRDGDR